MTQNLLKIAKENEEKIKKLRELEEKQLIDLRFIRDNAASILEKEIRELNDKIYSIKMAYIDKSEVLTKGTGQAVEILNLEIEKKERILKLIEVAFKERNGGLGDFEVYKYDYPRDDKGEVIRINGSYPNKEKIHYKPIGIIAQDSFKEIKVYLVENNSYRKKVNKFSLVIVGRTLFTDGLIKLPRSYGLGCNTKGEHIAQFIKEAPTREELIKYYNKNTYKLLKDLLIEHSKLEEEFKEAKKLFEEKEWKIAYWESKKDYYENHYSHGTEKEEYKQVIAKLEELQNEN